MYKLMNYILYKEPISLNTLYIVQYLHFNNIKILPKTIIERNHEFKILPSIKCENGNVYIGLNEVIRFYEEFSGINNLLTKAIEWKKNNPNYRINDNLN